MRRRSLSRNRRFGNARATGALVPRPTPSAYAQHPRFLQRGAALKGVDFDVYAGEIHALVGEHRAGKSSLVKLLSGAVQKTQGEIIYQGVEVKYFTPESAIQAGVGMVYQNMNVIPSLNAIDNIFAGRMIQGRFRGLDHRRMILIGSGALSANECQDRPGAAPVPSLPGATAHGRVCPYALPATRSS